MKFFRPIFFLAFSLLISKNSMAQCEMWIPPLGGVSYGNFNEDFGGAPCDDGTGCVFNEITGFQVYAAEAYRADNFVQGGEYVFSICNGPDAGSWVPEFTVIAPSGAVDAFGGGDGDSCTITWIATESGTYTIVINEEGECGGGDNIAANNGYPAMTCLGGAGECIPIDSICNTGVMTTLGEFVVCGSEDSVNIEVLSTIVPETGGFGYSFGNELGGSGALANGFVLSNADPIIAFTSDVNGVLSDNNLDPLSGLWVIKSVVYDDAEDPSNSICNISQDSMIVNFLPDLLLEIQNNGDGSATANVTGGTAPYTYAWSDDASQSGETASNLPDGEFTVVVTDAEGCHIEGTVAVVMSSLENLKIVEKIKIGPNPSDGRIKINLQLNEVENVLIEVLDLNGKVIRQTNVRSDSFHSDFNLESLSSGIYLVHIRVGNESNYERILISQQ